ncbi:MAG: phosphopentomutase [Alphaproteobacteria bacterium]|nr:phosphopentomutase [Alphaproteobacteria bacterium]
MGKAIILMMDSFGIGGAPDAAQYNDKGANTFGNIAKANLGLNIPNLVKLGLAKAAENACGQAPQIGIQDIAQLSLPSKYGHAKELSRAKDTTSGHWEMAGIPVLQEWGYFPKSEPSFPHELISSICQRAGISGILGNRAASGTKIIEELGETHIKTGMPIFYTSVDSCLQIAAHEKYFGLQKLYDLCQIAFEEVRPYKIARVIARPFIGESSTDFVRTGNRHDYSVAPFAPTLLDKLKARKHSVIALGKISDIFAGQGISKKVPASGLEELWNKTLQEISAAPDNSLIFTNFVDFDMVYGHRRDVKGYARALEYFDKRLPEIAGVLQADDIVFITADHGNDPTYTGTDHTREQVPVIMFGKHVKPADIGQRQTFADIAQTIAEYFNIEPFEYGTSFLKD